MDGRIILYVMNDHKKGNAMARWSESEKRLDRGDIAAKNGGSRVRQCIKEPQGQRRSERIMRPCV